MNNYTDQINDYVSNYQQAVKNIEVIVSKLDELYLSFSSANGNDITNIKNDIDNIRNELLNIKKRVTDAKTKTVSRAESCNRCYNKYLNKEYPAYETSDRYYGSGASVYIASDGIIHVSREYGRKQSFIESIFMSSAGEYYDDEAISKEEMFNS